MAKKKNDLFESSTSSSKANFDQDKEIAAKLVAVYIQEIERLGVKRQMSLDDIIKSYNYCFQKLKEKNFTGELHDFISTEENHLKKTKPFFDFSAKKPSKENQDTEKEDMSQDEVDAESLDEDLDYSDDEDLEEEIEEEK